MINWRLPQQAIINYSGGKMGVSAVPGSGKTQTLSGLAARLIIENRVDDDQEVLIVTLVNSAVDNFSSRIEKFLAPYHLVPGMGYRVRTLHGLAHDIVRERPDLVGLSTQFQIIDERDGEAIIAESTLAWLRANPDIHYDFLKDDLDANSLQKALTRDWPALITQIAGNTIRQAKDLQATPELIQEKMAQLSFSPPLVRMGADIYQDYQRALNYRNAVDFNDLIRLALQALNTDPEYLARLRRRWPFILEDEAQDSSRLQEQILQLLAGEKGNWVRVGDPNQAIYETFTTADPEYLKRFRDQPDVDKKDLPHSGRSTQSIINLANHLNEWVQTSHPVHALRTALTDPLIEPTPLFDPQPNPPDNSRGIFFTREIWTSENEIHKVVDSICRWLPEHSEHTVAVLVPRNDRGAEVVAELRRNGIEPVEMLRTSQSTRHTAAVLATILQHLADPTHINKFAALLPLVSITEDSSEEYKKLILTIQKSLRTIRFLEDFLYPRPDRDWLMNSLANGMDEGTAAQLNDFRRLLLNWHATVHLPIDQLILTIAQDIFSHPADLALSHNLALALEQTAQSHPEWGLMEFVLELEQIASNKRKFIGFSEEDTGFDPDQYKGKVVVATIHKAKGLEWDRVHLLSVNNYDFPDPLNFDSWISEKWFIRQQLNLEAETIEKMKALINDDIIGLNLETGEATMQARLDYAAERLRLLFVGITRARKELLITWNTGRKGTCVLATALDALIRFKEDQTDALID